MSLRDHIPATTTCQSEGCTGRGTTFVADNHRPRDLPELYCRDCAQTLVGEASLRPAKGVRAFVWRLADEFRAHHHACASFLLTGMSLASGLRGFAAWIMLGLFLTSVVADIVAMHRRARALWPLCVPPMIIGIVGAGARLEPVSYLAIAAAGLYLFLVAFAALRGAESRSDS